MRSGTTIIRALICCGALWTAMPVTPLCGQIRIVPQTLIDSLARPGMAKGAEAMRFDRTLIHAGQIGENDTPSSYTFRWNNLGSTPLVITRVRTSCGCAVATWDKKPVLAKGEGSVTVTYHPKGHPGVFDRRIFVYTQLSDKMPTAILNLRGTVAASEHVDDDYPYAIGYLRLKQQAIRFSAAGRQTERIECLNSGSKPLQPTCDKRLLPPYITFACEPEQLAPGQKGDLVVGFNPSGIMQSLRRIPLLLEGADLPPSQCMIWIEFGEKE